MKRILLIAVAFCFLYASVNAQKRSEKDAVKVAQDYFGKSKTNIRISVVPGKNVDKQIRRKVKGIDTGASPEQSFYVINDEANNRFVIVGADERMNTVLGYSDNGLFSESTAPEGLLEMLADYNQQYSKLLTLQIDLGDVTNTDVEFESVEPMIKSKWHQTSPYNNDCPIDPQYSYDARCASGCVATAMAQIMNYHRYPNSGKGSYSYKTSTLKIYQYCNFSDLFFDWDKMLDIYDSNATSEQKAEVAKLMHACGISVSMNYGYNGSNACSCDVPYALIHHFGYNPNITYKEKKYYSNYEWNKMILDELKRGRPILYRGNGTGGHAFVLDGCNSDGLYHFNFGWSGSYDGFYCIDAIKLYKNGVEKYNFTSNQGMTSNITPEENGIHEDIFYCSSFYLTNEKMVVGGTTSFRCVVPECDSSDATYVGHSSAKFVGTIGLGLFDSNLNFVKSLYYKDISCYQGTLKTISSDVIMDGETLKDGSMYFIAPYAQSSNAVMPTFIRTIDGSTDCYLAKVKDGMIDLIPMEFPLAPIEPDNPEPSPEPTHKVIEGTYTVSAPTKGDKVEDWTVTLMQDNVDSDKYWLIGYDPAVSRLGYTVSSGWNRVCGTVNENKTQIVIPTRNQNKLGDNIYLTNISEGGDLVLYLNDTDSTMSIKSVWGCMKRTITGDNYTQSEVSQYTSSTFKYGDSTTSLTAPIVFVSDEGVLNITSQNTNDVIYYTIDGQEPSEKSILYSSPVHLDRNVTVKAIAINGDKKSDVSQYTVRVFVASPPVIKVDKTTVSITTSTEDALIFYTIDGTTPDNKSRKYEGEFSLSQSAVIKAIAKKDGFIESEVATYTYRHVIPVKSIDNIVAGTLQDNISDEEAVDITSLKISGELNGTDIKLLRKMIIDGKLTDLDIQQCRIVGGGEEYYTTSYKSYVTSDNVIGANMFYNCKKLISLVLPETINKIETDAFYRCDNLAELRIPSSCEEIESSGIAYCSSLQTVTISDGLNNIGSLNFNGCQSLVNFVVESGNTEYKAVDGVLFTIDGQELLKYPQGKTNENYSIPSSVRIIGGYSFAYSNLSTVEIPNSVNVIESSAFYYSKNLDNVVVPNSVTKIEMSAFSNCSNLNTIKLSESIKKLEAFVLSYCVSLQNVDIPKSVQEVDGYALSGCSSLTSINVDPDNEWLSSVGGVLYTKDLKKLIKCPMTMYAEQYRAADGVEEICNNAFNKCTNIKEFYLPESVRKIGISAFSYCNIHMISIPENVQSIDMMAFENCDSLRAFAIPDGIEKLNMQILGYCDSLAYVSIPSSVKSMDLSVFANCKALRMIDCAIKNPSDVKISESYGGGYNQFANIPSDCTWRIPAGTSSSYKAQPWWVSTWQIIENPVVGDVDGDGNVNITDVVGVINYIAGTSNLTADKCDINGDSSVNISDVVGIINIIAGN